MRVCVCVCGNRFFCLVERKGEKKQIGVHYHTIMMRGPARPSEWQPVPVRVSVGPPPRTDDRRREQQEPSEAAEADDDAENCVYCREGRPHPDVPDETPAPTAPAAPAPRKRLPVKSVSSSVGHVSHESASESAHKTHQRAPRAPAATEHKRVAAAAAGSTHSHIFVFDRTGKMVQGSPNVLQMYAPEAHRIEHILSPHTRTWIQDQAIFSGGDTSTVGRRLADVRLRRAKGSGPRAKHHITGTLTVSPLKNEKGERLLLCELVSTGSPPTVPPVAPPPPLPRSSPKPSASAEDSGSHKKQRKGQRKRGKSKSASYVPTARRRGSRRT